MIAAEIDAPPTRIGAYRIVRLLGRGGMGGVYLAEQSEPVRREVAIKLLTTGIDSDVFVARFEAERQVLAVLDHPNITKVFDAGVTESGVPYFVMEHVSGVPLTEYADAHKLDITQRIRLFLQICRAVQHAHQKGIIHRDLKPSNVLVTDADGAPQCKVIDFGIAKAVAGDTRLTLTGISLGTPAYMSPEQATGQADVDTRSDVYALGVILYELLAGALPFESTSTFGLIMMAQHGDAPAPSARLAALDANRQKELAELRRSDASTLRKELSEDLDWITLKAIEREREARYSSVNDLTADLERHFADQPVSVGPPTGVYRFRKFVRRHRLSVSFAAATLLLIVGFAITVTVQKGRVDRARAVAERRQGQAEELIGFMLGDLRPRLQAEGHIEILDEVARKAMAYFAAVPEAELSNEELFRRSQALSQLGEVRMAQGNVDSAMSAFKASLVLAQQLARRDSFNGQWQLGLGASHFWVGNIHYRRNDLDSALAHFTAYLRITDALVARAPDSLTYRNENALAHSNVGSTKEAMGDLRGALGEFQTKTAIEEELVRRDSTNLEWRRDLGNAYNTVGVTQRKLGDIARAEKSHRDELAVKTAIAARDPANHNYQEMVALAESYLGETLTIEGKPAEGAPILASSRTRYAALAAYDTANPDRRRQVALLDRQIGMTALERGDAAGALKTTLGGQAVLESLVAKAPTNTVWQYNLARLRGAVGSAQLELKSYADAKASSRAALAIVEPALQKRASDLNARVAVTEAYLTIGEAEALDGRMTEAKQAWTQALTTIDSVARARQITDHLALRASALLYLNRLEEARPIVAELTRRGYRRPRWIALVRKHLPQVTFN
jgi:serine/threonine-protein kinase